MKFILYQNLRVIFLLASHDLFMRDLQGSRAHFGQNLELFLGPVTSIRTKSLNYFFDRSENNILESTI